MRCTHCGADIPEGMLICPDCRNEVQMVPDYNPLEDVLVREVRGSTISKRSGSGERKFYARIESGRTGADPGRTNGKNFLCQEREYARWQDTG